MAAIRCKCGNSVDVSARAAGGKAACSHCRSKFRFVAAQVSGEADDVHGALLIEQGPGGVGNHLVLGGVGAIEIGKLPGKHIRLPGDRVSRFHCRLVRSGSSWLIEDNGSTNGVFVNKKRTTRHELADDDCIQIGDFLLRYRRAYDAPLMEADLDLSDEPFADDQTAGLELHGLYDLADGEVVELEEPAPEAPVEREEDLGDDPRACPVCHKLFPKSAKICVQCGIDLKTGQVLLTSHAADLDTIYANAEESIRWLSWVFCLGVYPIASEAFGSHKPRVIHAIAIVTTLVSLWGFFAFASGPKGEREVLEYALWCGQPAANEVDGVELGDVPTDESEAAGELELTAEDEELFELVQGLTVARPVMDFHPSQLITHAFLHGDIIHLAGNLLFLLVFGSRVNALLGNTVTALLYPVLAIGAGLVHQASAANALPRPMIGASGAIMGLAGIYFVLLSAHKVHMAMWWRPVWFWWLGRFELHLKLTAWKGYTVVLFYIAFDVIYTVFGWEDGVAHWAHLGGFIVGVVIGLALLLTHLVNTRGGDVFTGLFGRHAWAIIGKPSTKPGPLERVW